MRRVLSLLLTFVLLLTAVPIAGAAAKFRDVPRDHWAYAAIMTMAEKGIIKGYGDGTFRPNNEVTRAEFAKIMVAAAGIEIDRNRWIKQTFEDVDRDHWAFYYVELAKPYLTGYKMGSFYLYKPDDEAVREDIAVALVRLLGYDRTMKADLSVLDRFRDENRISPNLRPFIAIAVSTGLIKGFEDRTFRPQDPLTRAEAASLLFRALLDGTKVVFPGDEKPPQPNEPVTLTDDFSDAGMKQWDKENANALWGVYQNAATAFSQDDDVDHYFLPLKWKGDGETKGFELKTDVIAKGTEGLGGLYFKGDDGKTYVVYVSKNAVVLGQVTDAKRREINLVASATYKLRETNTIRVVVKDGTCSIYLNGAFLFGQKWATPSGAVVGLYLQKAATQHIPDEITLFDNFAFREWK